MTGRDDIDMTAAEYVLGTLDVTERASIERRRAGEPDLDRAILAWQRRLAPLADTVAPVEPPPGLLALIERRIAAIKHESASAGADPGSIPPAAVIVQLERRVARWRQVAVAASALAAGLAVFVGLGDRIRPRDPQTFVAVFQHDDKQPAFLMSVDLASREMTIRAVTAGKPTGKAYQLWIVAESFGPKPHSLGLLDGDLGPTRKRLAELPPAVLQNATFGISEEPPGGSPTGQPTGRAIHGKLHHAAP